MRFAFGDIPTCTLTQAGTNPCNLTVMQPRDSNRIQTMFLRLGQGTSWERVLQMEAFFRLFQLATLYFYNVRTPTILVVRLLCAKPNCSPGHLRSSPTQFPLRNRPFQLIETREKWAANNVSCLFCCARCTKARTHTHTAMEIFRINNK